MNRHVDVKKFSIIILGLLLLLITGLFGGYQIVKGANTLDDGKTTNKADNTDFDKALSTAPKGLAWNYGDFVLADFNKAAQSRNDPHITNSNNDLNPLSTYQNNADLIKSTNPNSLDTSIIQMTNDQYQTGAVWSNMSKNNYFDVSHEQVASMWLYFGNIIKGDLPGDGMAFVLQNDPNGENAIALSNGIPVNGQSLGVWGADWDYNNSSSEVVANTAIKKSWALEFDTFLNFQNSSAQITGEGVSFDAAVPNINGQHIAGGYPAQPNTYKRFYDYPKNYFIMNHQGTKDNLTLVDSKWHHVTIKWVPGASSTDTGTLTYRYNDKNPTTGAPITQGVISQNFSIDPKLLGITSDSTKLYWGFTGSTGRNSENNLLIFESIPSFVDAEATPAIYDDTKGGTEIKSGETVDPNDDIRYTYSLNYKGWAKQWNYINAIMDVPDNVHFTSGTVTYKDSTAGSTPRPIPASVFENINDKKITYKLPEGLNKDSRNAVIELKGHTEKIAPKVLNVPSAHASFQGDNLIKDANTVPFKISQKSLSLDSSTGNPIKIKPNDGVDIPAQVSYVGSNGTPNYANMSVYQTLNGKTTRLQNIIHSDGSFTLSIINSDLHDSNDLSFYVQDDNYYYNYGTSNRVTRKIITDGGLSFGIVQPTASFKAIQSYSSNRLVPRLGKWQVDVHDSRETGSSWTVQAKATNLINGQKKLNGHLVYKDPRNNTVSTLINNPVTVATGTKEPLDTDIKNITDSWTSQNGILLAMDHPYRNEKGTYTGTINWNLIDGIKND